NNIDTVQPGQQIDFSPLMEDKVIGKIFESSDSLNEEAIGNIIKNNETIAKWISENPDKSLTTEKVKEVISGVTEENMVEELKETSEASSATEPIEDTPEPEEEIKEKPEPTPTTEEETESTSSKEDIDLTDKREVFYSKFAEKFGGEEVYGNTMKRVTSALMNGEVTPQQYCDFLENEVYEGDELPFDKEDYVKQLDHYIEEAESAEGAESKMQQSHLRLSAEKKLINSISRDVVFLQGDPSEVGARFPESNGTEVPKAEYENKVRSSVGVFPDSLEEDHAPISQPEAEEIKEKPEPTPTTEEETEDISFEPIPEDGLYVSEIGSGGSVWQSAEDIMERNFGDRFNELNEAQKIHLLDQVRDEIAKDPSKFGLKGVDNIDIVQPGDKLDLSPLIKGGLMGKMFDSAGGLSEKDISDIISNNEKFEEWISENPDKSLTTETVKEVISGASEEGAEESVKETPEAPPAPEPIEDTPEPEEEIKEKPEPTPTTEEIKEPEIQEAEEPPEPEEAEVEPEESEPKPETAPPEADQETTEDSEEPVQEVPEEKGSHFNFENFDFERDEQGNVKDFGYNGNFHNFDPRDLVETSTPEEQSLYMENRGDIDTTLRQIKVYQEALEKIVDVGTPEYQWLEDRLNDNIDRLENDYGDIVKGDNLRDAFSLENETGATPENSTEGPSSSAEEAPEHTPEEGVESDTSSVEGVMERYNISEGSEETIKGLLNTIESSGLEGPSRQALMDLYFENWNAEIPSEKTEEVLGNFFGEEYDKIGEFFEDAREITKDDSGNTIVTLSRTKWVNWNNWDIIISPEGTVAVDGPSGWGLSERVLNKDTLESLRSYIYSYAEKVG
ncbi:MAG: hypothetical protein ACQESA_00235, partial [Patescibacteria group bacterium]